MSPCGEHTFGWVLGEQTIGNPETAKRRVPVPLHHSQGPRCLVKHCYKYCGEHQVCQQYTAYESASVALEATQSLPQLFQDVD